ncbi:MAG TPA: hypothetical protein PL048_14810 [Leptospiraceae bacterium]|nr:hypothetical protein [Leptospiraceae bacterium]HMZ60044.1 hypothetical protein [Leptospiraceae bacterium]HNF12574.1 hypothetical protein [Leptospiraceae bacterium]HNF25713.1 hypothetical protein [Leptospiraceae bacterium]HNI96936.1 hypothetical protein [Leptospiraceae bacterium]
MFAESKDEKARQAEVNGLESNQHIDCILVYLEKYIPSFTEKTELLENEKENKINSKLSMYLNRSIAEENHFPYIFDRENPDSKSPEDIIVSYKAGRREITVFVIECKRLPTPPPEDREKEYVSGKGAGIQRFKELDQGKNFSIAAMIGYIEKENFSYWFTQINSWIEELSNHEKTIWNHKERLQKEYDREDFAKYISSHSRTDRPPIKLVHFWILKS